MLDINLPLLTDEGAKALGAIGEKVVPSQTTSLVLIGSVFLICSGCLALAFYKEVHKGDSTKHTVEHHDCTSKPYTRV